MIANIAALAAIAFAATCYAACNCGSGSSVPVPDGAGGANACTAPIACPAGAFEMCEPTAAQVTCCDGNEEHLACAVDAGLLTHTCPGCEGSAPLCAVASDGTVDCHPFGTE